MHAWKNSLFVWRGRLDIGAASTKWRGAWVSTEDPAADFPSDAAFAQSNTTFEVCGSEGLNLDADNYQTIQWVGDYLLDNGDGLEKYSDFLHECCLIKVDSDDDDDGGGRKLTHRVTARGETEFGVFISAGIVERTSNSTSDEAVYELTLARRYMMSESDARYKAPLLDRLLEARSSRPWEHIPLKIKQIKIGSKTETSNSGGTTKKSGKRKRSAGV